MLAKDKIVIEVFSFDCQNKNEIKNILYIYIYLLLLKKITGGPSGPLAIIYFFQKKRTYKHTNKHTNKQT